MLNRYRTFLFTIFAGFFVVSFPFLIIYSLGYDLNFRSQSLQNSLTAYIQTVPRGANIPTKQRIYKTPIELKINPNQFTEVSVESDEFVTEKFVFSSTDQNAAVRVDNLWLLPNTASNTVSVAEGFSPVNFLSDRYALLERDSRMYIQGYNFGGLESEPSELDLDYSDDFKNTRWEMLLEDIFWHPGLNILLSRTSSNDWRVVDLSALPFSVSSVANISPTQVLLMSRTGSLWLYNLETEVYVFLDNGIDGLSFTDSPDNIWVLKYDSIYRVDRSNSEVLVENFNLESNLHASFAQIGDLSQRIKEPDFEKFVSKNLFLGLMFKINDTTFYISDSDSSLMQIITQDAIAVGTSNSTVFYLDEDLVLNSYNLFNKDWQTFGSLFEYLGEDFDPSDVRINYYQTWNRVIIYDLDQVISIWFDTTNVNTPIVQYFPVSWIQDEYCYFEIIDNNQFCFNDNNLKFYKNNSIPW
jgi:hypothetical protein